MLETLCLLHRPYVTPILAPGSDINGARWAPTIYKWSYNPYKCPCKWVTGVYNPTSRGYNCYNPVYNW